jgi:hypothetical protein
MSNIKMSRSTSPKEMHVRVMSIAAHKTAEFDISKLKEEYDREGGNLRNWNLFSGGGVGACIGLVACITTTAVGIPISMPAILALVCGSLLCGVAAGYILY